MLTLRATMYYIWILVLFFYVVNVWSSPVATTALSPQVHGPALSPSSLFVEYASESGHSLVATIELDIKHLRYRLISDCLNVATLYDVSSVSVIVNSTATAVNKGSLIGAVHATVGSLGPCPLNVGPTTYGHINHCTTDLSGAVLKWSSVTVADSCGKWSSLTLTVI
jgi:hypothetical protein